VLDRETTVEDGGLRDSKWRQKLNEQSTVSLYELYERANVSQDPAGKALVWSRLGWVAEDAVVPPPVPPPAGWEQPDARGDDETRGETPRRLQSKTEVEVAGSKTPWLLTASDLAHDSLHDDGALARLTHPRFRSRLKLPDPREHLFQRARAQRIFGEEARLALRAVRELGLSMADVEMRKKETWKTQKHYARHGTHRAARILARKSARQRVEALVEQRADALTAMIRGYRLGLAYLRSLGDIEYGEGDRAREGMIQPIGPDARAIRRRRRSYWIEEQCLPANLYPSFERDLKLGWIHPTRDGRERLAAVDHRLAAALVLIDVRFTIQSERYCEDEVRSCPAWGEPVPRWPIDPRRIDAGRFRKICRKLSTGWYIHKEKTNVSPF
jgi:hypothetical protein